MKFREISIIAVAVIMIAFCYLGFNNADAEAIQDGTSENPYLQTITVSNYTPELFYLNTNLSAFSFPDPGDCFRLQIDIGTVHLLIVAHKELKNGKWVFTDWPTSTNELGIGYHSVNIYVDKLDDDGTLVLQIVNVGDESVQFYATVTVISNGVSQEKHYTFTVNSTITETYSLTFTKAIIKTEGLFQSVGTLKLGDVIVDPSDYNFYANGLYSGIAIQSDLTVRGRVDTTDSNWVNNTSINPTIVISKGSSEKYSIVHPTIEYEFDTTVENITFSVQNNSGKIITNSSGSKSLSVLSNEPLTITVRNGTEAQIIGDGVSNFDTILMTSTTSGSFSRTINNLGVGAYTITFTNITSSESDTVTITVIASLVPTNSIHISCGPSP